MSRQPVLLVKYEGESIIICNALAFVFVGNTVVIPRIARRGSRPITVAQI